MPDGEIDDFLSGDKGYLAIQQTPGVGRRSSPPSSPPVLGAGIGDVARFSSPEKPCRWAGLTPRHREPDLQVHRGPITKKGSRILGWAETEAASRHHGAPAEGFETIAQRPASREIARVALARHIATLAR